MVSIRFARAITLAIAALTTVGLAAAPAEAAAVPVVQSVAPVSGAVTGGNTVTVRGSNLTGATKVVFGTSVATDVRVRSDTELTAVAPKRSAGVVDVRVTTAAGQSATSSADRYYYAPPPAVTGLSPAKGSLKGAAVTIKGTALAGTGKVLFGTAEATVSSRSDTAIAVTAPAHAAGKVGVTVTTQYGTSPVTSNSTYEYVAGPPGVTGLRAALSGRSVSLTWINPSNVTQITVRKAAGSVPPRGLTDGTSVPVSGTPTGVTDTVDEFEPVSYSVFAQTGTALSAKQYSDAVGVTASAPGRITDLTSEPTPGRLTFSWRNPAGVDHAIVSVDAGHTMTPRAGATGGTNIGTAQTYTATGLSSRSSYTFWITLFDAAGNYAGSSSSDAYTEDGDDVAPGVVTAVRAAAKPTSVALTWSLPSESDVAGVAVSRAAGTVAPATPTTPWVVGESGYDATTITDDAAIPGRTYTYGLWAYDYSGNYSARAVITTTTPAGSPPAAVTGVSATALPPNVTGRGQAVDLRWTNPAGAVSTLLVRGTGATAPASIADGVARTLPAPASDFVDSGLAAATPYSYSLWAVAADGTKSPVVSVAATSDPNTPRPVTGVVRNSVTKQPLTSATLRFKREGDTVATTSSDSAGRYSTNLPVGTYMLDIYGVDATGGGAAHGYLDLSVEVVVTAAAATAFDPKIDPAVAVVGTITDASSGKPLANVLVAVPAPPNQPFWPYRAVTDANGRYVLGKLGKVPDPLDLDVVADVTTPGAVHGYAPGVISFTAKTYGLTVTKNFALTPLPVVTVTGKLTSTADTSPVVGATIVPLVDGRRPDRRPVFKTGTDGSFTASIGATAKQQVQICFDAERNTGYTNQCFGGADYTLVYDQVHLVGTATVVRDGQNVSTKLVPRSVVTGTVRDSEGSPLAGVSVGASVYDRAEFAYPTETDATGRYQIRTPIRPGRYDAEPVSVCTKVSSKTTGGSSKASYHDRCSPRVQVTAANRSATVDLALASTAGAAGRVTDLESGEPLGRVLVSLRTSSNYESGRVFTEADGTWRVDDLEPADKPVTVCFDLEYYKGPGGALYPDQCAGLDDPTTVTPVVGDVARVDAALVRSATVTGVLRGSDTGAPLPGVLVHLDNPVTGPAATTDDDGRYLFTGVEPGIASGDAVDPHRVYGPPVRQGRLGYDPGDVSVSTSAGKTSTVDLVLRPAAAIDVEVVTQGGLPVSGARLSRVGLYDPRLEPEGVRTGSDGRARVTGLRAVLADTRNYICASGGEGPGTGDNVGFGDRCVHLPTLRSGQVATARIVLPPWRGRVVTTVVDAVTRQPVTNAAVTYFKEKDGRFTEWQSSSGTGLSGVASPVQIGDGIEIDYPFFRPTTATRWRQCVSAPFYVTTCGSGGATDGSAGPVFTTVPGVDTAVAVSLHKKA